jgi:F-type H+-transporting ATPase subunit gamma
MAQNLQLLKRRIKTSKNIAQMAKAMEMISASKIKRGQSISASNKPYAENITTITAKMIKSFDSKTKGSFSHPYLNRNESNKSLIIVITPDRGSCGSLNTNLFKKMLEIENAASKIVTVGKKAGIFSAKLNHDLLASYPMGNSIPGYSLVYQLKSIIDDEILNERAGSVSIIYANFISLFTQTPIVKKLLPLDIDAVEQTDISDSSLFEPSRSELLKELLPYYLEVQLYDALLQAFTSEQAARMVAMQNAKNNANDIAEYLNLVYNRSRQERITNEILDLANSKQI